MKKILFSVSALLLSLACHAQADAAQRMIDEGIALYDKGDYASALVNYDKALQFDPDNLKALSEMALTQYALEKYDDAVATCRTAIEKHPDDKELVSVYVTYGSALDSQKKSDAAVSVYDDGIKKFPDAYELPFNKGVALAGQEKYDDAILAFEKAVQLNPQHAGSHNAIARISMNHDKNIAALLAYSRFFILEQESERAVQNLAMVKKIMGSGVKKTGRNSVSINISAETLSDSTSDGKKKENSFSTTELILMTSAALDFDKSNKNKSEVEMFRSKFETVCSSLSEKGDNYGFFWDYYVPYFTEMYNKNFVETFAYIVYDSGNDPAVKKWIHNHKEQIQAFYTWSRAYNWPKKA